MIVLSSHTLYIYLLRSRCSSVAVLQVWLEKHSSSWSNFSRCSQYSGSTNIASIDYIIAVLKWLHYYWNKRWNEQACGAAVTMSKHNLSSLYSNYILSKNKKSTKRKEQLSLKRCCWSPFVCQGCQSSSIIIAYECGNKWGAAFLNRQRNHKNSWLRRITDTCLEGAAASVVAQIACLWLTKTYGTPQSRWSDSEVSQIPNIAART